MKDSIAKAQVENTLRRHGFDMIETFDGVDIWVSKRDFGSTIVQLDSGYNRMGVLEFEILAETIGIHHWELDYILDPTHTN